MSRFHDVDVPTVYVGGILGVCALMVLALHFFASPGRSIQAAQEHRSASRTENKWYYVSNRSQTCVAGDDYENPAVFLRSLQLQNQYHTVVDDRDPETGAISKTTITDFRNDGGTWTYTFYRELSECQKVVDAAAAEITSHE